MADGYDELTEKEKETLRLMARGHDAKSAAIALSLSVHAINERLRAARRKLAVTSSREAARLVLEHEDPENSVEEDLGGCRWGTHGDLAPAPETRQPGGWGEGRKAALLTGGILMSLLAAALLLSAPLAPDDAGSHDAEFAARDAAVEAAARSWLNLVDARDWEASYAGTAAAFRKANTLKLWSDTAQSVHDDLGTMLSRQLLGVDDVPSPQGITIVKFRTDYTDRAGVIETVSLVREDGAWKVAGIYIS